MKKILYKFHSQNCGTLTKNFFNFYLTFPTR
nr:MAG TPA: hypothetical protein [Caudoviricetes sp.]